MHAKKKINRLFLRFLITYFIIVFIPMLILGAYVYRYFFDYMKNNLETSRYASLEQVCSTHENLLTQMEAIANQIYLSGSFHKFELKQNPEKTLPVIENLNILTQTTPYLDEIAFHFSGDSYIYSSSGSNTVDMFFRDFFFNPEIYTEEFIQELFSATKSFVIPMHHISSFRKNLDAVVFVHPIPAQSYSPYATALFYVSYETYTQMIAIGEGQPENMYIVENDRIIFQTDNLTVSPSILDQMLESENTFQYFEEDGTQYLAIHACQPYSSLAYYQLIDLNDVYAPLHEAQAVFLILNGMLLLLCGVLTFVFSHINYNPLKKIQQRLRLLSLPAVSHSGNELERLLDGIDYVYQQNQSMNLEIAQSKDAKRSVILVNFMKGRYPTRENMLPFCENIEIHVEYGFFDIWLVQFHATSPITPIDEETAAIFNRSEAGLDLHATELLTSDTLAVVTFLEDRKTQKQRAAAIADQLSVYGFLGVIGISCVYSDFSNAPKAFLEASMALTQHDLSQNKEITFFQDLNSKTLQLSTYPYGLLDQFGKALSNRNPDKLISLGEDIILFIHKNPLPHFLIQSILRDMADSLIRHCIQTGINDSGHALIYSDIQGVNSMHAFEKCIHKLIRLGKDIMNQCEPGEAATDDLLPIIQYINANCISPDFSLYNVAERFHMSPSQLTNAFKAELHISPSAFITGYKMRMAKYMLTNTSDSVQDICTALGYNDTSSFIRKFRQEVGQTPTAYRKETAGSDVVR